MTLSGTYLFPIHFPQNEIHALRDPVLLLQENIRNIFILNTICLQPDIQESLRYKAEYSLIILVILTDIQSFLQFKQNRKKPFTVLICQFLLHNEHIKTMTCCSFHHFVIRFYILRIFLFNDFSGFIQINSMMSMLLSYVLLNMKTSEKCIHRI